MSSEEQAIADDKMRSEISNLIAETGRLNAEAAKFRLETFKIASKMAAERSEIAAETSEIARERFWIPFTVFAGVIVAIVFIIPRIFG